MSIRSFLPSIESCAAAVFALAASIGGGPEPAKLADTYVEAVREVNEAHAKNPVRGDEAALSKKFPNAAVLALDSLLATDAGKKKAKELRALFC